MPQASFATRADQIVGALRKKYRTQEEVLKALGLIAHDEAPEPEEKPAASRGAPGMTRLVRLLAAKLKPEDWADVQEHLARLAGGSAEAEAEDEDDEDLSPLERELSRADPLKNSAMDSAASLKRFGEMYPGAPRRDPLPQAAQRRLARAPSKSAVDSFAAMYPGAVKIKVA